MLHQTYGDSLDLSVSLASVFCFVLVPLAQCFYLSRGYGILVPFTTSVVYVPIGDKPNVAGAGRVEWADLAFRSLPWYGVGSLRLSVACLGFRTWQCT